MANQGKRGTRAENAAADELGAAGYDVVRSAGSKGAADLVAVHDSEIMFVQVKLGDTPRMPSPAERRELLRIAGRCDRHAYAVVACRIPGRGGKPPITLWRELTGTGPFDWREYVLASPDPQKAVVPA